MFQHWRWSAAVAASVLIATSILRADEAPVAQFAEPDYNFGTVVEGAVVKHDYVFTNSGTAPLVVSGVFPDCGCVVVGRWSARVAPGQSGRVPVEFSSTGHGGELEKWIFALTNDPRHSKVLLKFKGTVSRLIDVSPPNVVFSLPAGTAASETKLVRITNNTGSPLVLSPPEGGSAAFTIELKTLRPEKEFELRVTTVPPLAAGMASALYSIKTNSSQVPMLTVTAVALVK
ncbi:MAG TPA: DUF1573 domain-containing protein [Opitutaceae bacterium]